MNFKTNAVAVKIKNFGIKIYELSFLLKCSRSQLYVYLDAYETGKFNKIPEEIKLAFDYLIWNNPTSDEFLHYCETNMVDRKGVNLSNFVSEKPKHKYPLSYLIGHMLFCCMVTSYDIKLINDGTDENYYLCLVLNIDGKEIKHTIELSKEEYKDIVLSL